MSQLSGRTPGTSYQEILTLDNTGAGLDSNLRSIEDGLGNSSPLKLSRTHLGIGDLVWPINTETVGTYLKIGASNQLEWGTVSSDDVEGGLSYTPVNEAAPQVTADMNMNSHLIHNLADPVSALDAVNQQTLDAQTTDDLTIVRTSTDQTIGGVKTFADDIILSGNLTVNGTTVTVNSETILVNDNIIELNSNFTSGTPSVNAGFQVLRGDLPTVQFIWDEANNRFTMRDTTGAYQALYTTADISAGSFTGNASSATKFQSPRTINSHVYDGTASLVLSTSDIGEGTNKYYLDSRAIAAVTPLVPVINPTSPKNGDIQVVGSVISIYAASGWRQIFPAVYS